MKILLNKALVLAVIIFVSTVFVSMVYAQSVSGIEFPIAELGNCANKEACRSYCDLSENYESCQTFAAKHNLGGVTVKEKFDAALADGGPGQCGTTAADPHEACRQYCDSADHMRECVAYAKTHDLMPEVELVEAEKVIAALDRGATLPVGCTNKESCRAICEAPPNVEAARQCFAFAEAAGFLPPGVNKEKAEIVFRAIEEGRAPFQTPREFEQCEDPASDEILQKCIDFGVANGFLSAEEAEMVKETGGKGPGGCRGKGQCEAYCSAHKDECFAFGVEHGLIKPEDTARMKGGMHRFKDSLSQAPAEVKKCLEESIDADTLQQLLAGESMPTEELGRQMRTCFENNFGDGKSGMIGKRFGNHFPPEVKSCLESKIGAEGVKKLLETGYNSGLEDAMKGCVQDAGQYKQEHEGTGYQGQEFKGPGGCTSRAECERYCTDSAHASECGWSGKLNEDGEERYQGTPLNTHPEETEKMIREKMMQEEREQYFREHDKQFPSEMNPDEIERMMREKQGQWESQDGSGPSDNYNQPESYKPLDTSSESEPMHSEPAPTSRLPWVAGSSLLANVVSILLSVLWR
jgi:hypothetical protein